MKEYDVKEYFKKGKEEYKRFVREYGRIPTEKEWNDIAKEKRLPSTVSMRYMGNIKYKK